MQPYPKRVTSRPSCIVAVSTAGGVGDANNRVRTSAVVSPSHALAGAPYWNCLPCGLPKRLMAFKHVGACRKTNHSSCEVIRAVASRPCRSPTEPQQTPTSHHLTVITTDSLGLSHWTPSSLCLANLTLHGNKRREGRIVGNHLSRTVTWGICRITSGHTQP